MVFGERAANVRLVPPAAQFLLGSSVVGFRVVNTTVSETGSVNLK